MFDLIKDELEKLPEDVSAQFWWRDDDATKTHPELVSLLQLAREFSIPLHLSVIPFSLDSTLVELVDDSPAIILQHGFSHKNFNPGSSTPSEFPAERSIAEICHSRLSFTFSPLNFQARGIRELEANQ